MQKTPTLKSSKKQNGDIKVFSIEISISRTEEVACYIAAILLVAVVLVLGFCCCRRCICVSNAGEEFMTGESERDDVVSEKPCDELYVVGKGETLDSIIEKCGDPYMVEHNPHIHDSDEVLPGLVLRMRPPNNT